MIQSALKNVGTFFSKMYILFGENVMSYTIKSNYNLMPIK